MLCGGSFRLEGGFSCIRLTSCFIFVFNSLSKWIIIKNLYKVSPFETNHSDANAWELDLFSEEKFLNLLEKFYVCGRHRVNW